MITIAALNEPFFVRKAIGGYFMLDCSLLENEFQSLPIIMGRGNEQFCCVCARATDEKISNRIDDLMFALQWNRTQIIE